MKTSSVLVAVGVASACLVVVLVLWLGVGRKPQSGNEPGGGLARRISAEAESVSAGSGLPASNRGSDGAGFFDAIKETLRIERVDSTADPRAKQRALVRRSFRQTERLLRGLKKQGLQGEDLFQEARRRLGEAGDPQALILLEGIRSFEQEMTEADLDAMSAQERWQYRRDARRAAFGEEMADMLFFKDEAIEEYRLREQAIRGNTALSEDARKGEIQKARDELKMKLASRGGAIVFPDERAQDMEKRLRDTYGEAVDSMSEEQRREATLDMLRSSLPPEVVRDLEEISQEEDRTASVRLPDEKVAEMNKKLQEAVQASLREKYGDAADSMSDEERRAAFLEMLRGGLSAAPVGQGGQ